MKVSKRLKEIPPYLFAEIDRKIEEKRERGVDVISFGVGDPDLPTPSQIVKVLQREAENPNNHRYPSYQGMPLFREAVSSWLRERFGLDFDPEREIIALLGTKEGLFHCPLAFMDQGDTALVPDPAYPVYGRAVHFCNASQVRFPLKEEDGFLPDLSAIPEDTWLKTEMIFLNYPNNPTTAVADLSFFDEIVEYSHRYDFIIVHDAAYSEITYDGYVSPSLLQVAGAKDTSLEFHSLSKTCNMTGWRIGFAAGGADLIESFGKIKTNIDSGVFNAVQHAAISALENSRDIAADNCRIYQRRRDLLIEALRDVGWRVTPPKATLYVWMSVPGGYDSASFARELLEEADIVVVPGSAYGEYGEGFVRFSLTLPDQRLEEGVRRIREAFS
ncbi:MAG: LL-diaminopimelate aminotransferase [Actinomycetota bacterium]|nr:LL-diaminopimelate aminotransferase [Actinomycetota bacterium]